LLFDSPAIHGREPRPPNPFASARAGARAEAGGGWPRFPGAEAPGYRNPNSPNYLVDDHKRRAIENPADRSNYLVDDHHGRAIENPADRSNCLVDDHHGRASKSNFNRRLKHAGHCPVDGIGQLQLVPKPSNGPALSADGKPINFSPDSSGLDTARVKFNSREFGARDRASELARDKATGRRLQPRLFPSFSLIPRCSSPGSRRKFLNENFRDFFLTK